MAEPNSSTHQRARQHLASLAIACFLVAMPLSAVRALPQQAPAPAPAEEDQASAEELAEAKRLFTEFREKLKASLSGAASDETKTLKKLARDIDRERQRIIKREYPERSLRAQSQKRKDLAGLAEMQSAAMGARAELGLIWLAAHQGPNGGWSANGFQDLCGLLNPGANCSGRGHAMHDVGVTGLALLAFVRANKASPSARWTETINRGRDYLLNNQRLLGSLASMKANAQSYDHLVALLALVELYPGDNDPRLKPAIASAVRFAKGLQQPGAGWRYAHPKSEDMLDMPNDVSATGWAIQALVALGDGGLPSEDKAVEDGLNYIAEMTDANGRTGYYMRGGLSSRMVGLDDRWPDQDTEAMTAVAVLSRALGDPTGRTDRNPDLQDNAIALLIDSPPLFATEPPDNGGVDYYYWYYGTRALAWAGGERWWRWLDALQQAADAHGIEANDELGSWGPSHGPWGGVGGRVYSTAIMTLSAIAAAHAE